MPARLAYRKHTRVLHGKSVASELHHLALQLVVKVEQGSVGNRSTRRESASSLEGNELHSLRMDTTSPTGFASV